MNLTVSDRPAGGFKASSALDGAMADDEEEEPGDPRDHAPPLPEVPRLFAEGAKRYNDGLYWEAHESWEEAWHSLRNAGRDDDARFLRGLILATAAFENLKREKPSGFQRQMAKALLRLRALAGRGERLLGLVGEEALRDALTDLFLDAMRVRHLEGLDDLDRAPPAIEADPERREPDRADPASRDP